MRTVHYQVFPKSYTIARNCLVTKMRDTYANTIREYAIQPLKVMT